MLEYIAEKKLNTNAMLLYSNRNPDEIAFKKELDLWQAQAENIKIFYTVTDCPPKDGVCIHGHISKGMVMERFGDVGNRMFFTFGPPQMVGAMKLLCIESGCNQELIKAENFNGY